MRTSQLKLIGVESLPSALRKRRRELKDVLGTQTPDNDPNLEMLDEIIELSIDDIPLGQWPPNLSSRFLSVVSGCALGALRNIYDADESRIHALQEIADLLCSVAAAAKSQVDNQVKLKVCRLWVASRLAEGVSFEESYEFLYSASASLQGLGVPHDELVSALQAEVSARFAPVQPEASNHNRQNRAESPAEFPSAAPPSTGNREISEPINVMSEAEESEVSIATGTTQTGQPSLVASGSETLSAPLKLAYPELEVSLAVDQYLDEPLELSSTSDLTAPEALQVSTSLNETTQTEKRSISNPEIVFEASSTMPSGSEHSNTHEEDVKHSPSRSVSSEAKASPRASEKRTIRRWQHLFRTESDANSRFADYVDELLTSSETIEAHVRQSIGLLKSAKREYERWVEQGKKGVTTAFLSPAVQATIIIAEKLLLFDLPQEAFWASNVASEFSKILVPRNREKYESVFERLISIACYAISDSWRSDVKPRAAVRGGNDIEKLRSRLTSIIIEQALVTYFKRGPNRFVDGRVDKVLGERVVNEALARHFDKQLRELLNADRPQVREYVRINMPVVYRLKLPGWFDGKKKEWEGLLKDAGFEDVVRDLRGFGDLVDPDQVGQVAEGQRDEIERAAARDDYVRVIELLQDSAKELRAYLYAEARRLLAYREPTDPYIENPEAWRIFTRAKRLSKEKERLPLERSLIELQNAWQLEINSLDLIDWVAYLQARTGNKQAAQDKFEQLQKRRGDQKNFATEWNLAVLQYEGNNEAGAYSLLVPLLDAGTIDQDLTLIVLALSLKLDDRSRFLTIVPRTMSLRYHPLALVIAHEMKDISRVEDFLAQMLAQWRGKWELPPVEQRFSGFEELKQRVVNKAIVEGQREQLIAWLEMRIQAVKGWVPNYLALAEVLEVWSQDIDGAFRVLRNRMELVSERGSRPRTSDDRIQAQRAVDQACEDMLDLCRRAKRTDLGQKAYDLAKKAAVREDLLSSNSAFAPPTIDQDPPHDDPTPPTPTVPALTPTYRDPQLADRVMWVNAGVAKIRNVSSYLDVVKSKEIEEFSNIVAEVGPHESGEALKMIRTITSAIETFSRTDAEKPEDRSTRRTLYSRVTGYEKDLAQLLRSNALSPQLVALITPYSKALQQVVGDLSRLAGVSPDLDVVVENPFLSLESSRTTLVLRVSNRSERPVTNVAVESISESPLVLIVGSRKKSIPRLESQKSELLSVPIERSGATGTDRVGEVTFAISLQASAEGFPDFDIGIKKLPVKVKTFQEAIGFTQIPKLFQEGPLRPSAPELFQGRSALLNNIRNSFYGGAQRERYFFDGIRRVGKTSILNFLPLYVPENILPVVATFDLLGLGSRFNSAIVLRRFCTLISDEVLKSTKVQLDPPDEAVFNVDPGRGFESFLTEFAVALPGRVPMLLIDEFQELLGNIAASGTDRNRDTLVLDQIRGHLDAERLYAIFTGSVRFDRLTRIVDHRIFGSLKRLPISFLDLESVGDVLQKGTDKWAIVPPETVQRVHDLTGGYPWLVQKYGLELVNLLNEEHRTIATPNDVEDVTMEKILWDNTHFQHWWPTDQLGANEERFIEWVLRKYPADQPVSIRSFFSDVGNREQQTFRLAFENLRACEVLDSTQTEYLRFSGSVLRRWLEQQLQDGQLHIRVQSEDAAELRGQAGIFIDHENLIKSLEEISVRRGVSVSPVGSSARVRWFSDILNNLLREAEERVGALAYKVAVAFWNRPDEAQISSPYHDNDFQLKQPENIGKGNEVDFKLADEARRARERARREGTVLSRAIILTGDGDLSHVARGLMNDGVALQIWGGSRNTGNKYIAVVGAGNFVALDDVCGL